MRHTYFSLCILLVCLAHTGNCEISDFPRCLDIETAWQRVLCYAPSIAAVDAEISILEGEAQQVSLLINPILEVESENLGVTSPSDDVEPPQTTFSLSQMIELGGKRSARRALADSLSAIASWDAQIKRQDALFELIIAFIHVQTAQEKKRLAQEKQSIGEQILATVKKQIQSGKLSPIQEKKAYIALVANRLAVQQACSELMQAKVHLASMWGSHCPDFETVDYAFFHYSTPPCQTCVLDGFYQTPEYKRAQQTVYSAARNLSLQQANSIPNVTLMAGYRVFHDSHEGGWVVGMECPIPFFDRNQGNVRSAAHGLSQAEYQLDEMVRETKERIFLIHQHVASSFEEIEMMHKGVLMEAQATVALTEEGYQKGKFEYMDFLETQKMLLDIRESYVDLLYEYHTHLAELMRLSQYDSNLLIGSNL